MAKINGAYLKELRISHNYTIRGLADALYVSKTTICNWEQDNSLDTLSIVQSLCNLYGIPLDEFVEKGTLGTDSPSIQSEIVISRGEPTENIVPIPETEIAISQDEPTGNIIPIPETKVVYAESKETRPKKKLHPILKTGIITFAICNFLILLFAMFVYMYIFFFTNDAMLGSHLKISYDIIALLIVYFFFSFIPSGIAMLIHHCIRRIRK